MDKKKVLLFAMTGFGNEAFEALMRIENISLEAVFIPDNRAHGEFPYYKCMPLDQLVSKHKNIRVFKNCSINDIIIKKAISDYSPDLIVVSTFNQIIPQEIISAPPYGVINVHPSLLPKYRGAVPTFWVLINGEKETGLTVHFIEDKHFDSGRIIIQSKIKIKSSDNDGTLRRKLAKSTKKLLRKALRLVFKKNKDYFVKQDASQATYYPRRNQKDAEIDPKEPIELIINRIRAVTPYPGANLRLKNRKYIVRKARMIKSRKYFRQAIPSKRKIYIFTSREELLEFEIVR